MKRCYRVMEHLTADYHVRIIVIGNSAVGKTCLLRYFTEGRKCSDGSQQGHDPTVGVDFFSRCVSVRGVSSDRPDVKLKLQIWDTAGQERFRAITQSYYRHVCGVVLVYDVTCRRSFAAVATRWYHEAMTHCRTAPAFVLAANKADMHALRQVSCEEAERWAAGYGMAHIECSAASGHGVSGVFERLAEAILARITSDGRLSAGGDDQAGWCAVTRLTAASSSSRRRPDGATRSGCCR